METIIFQVEDNGCGISKEIEEKIWNCPEGHFAIRNTHERIQLHYGTKYGLSMQSAPKGGLITCIVIPQKEEL